MSIRSLLVASGCVLALALSGCATSIAGSPQAAMPAAAAAADGSAADAAQDSPEEIAEVDGETTIPSDLGDILGGLEGSDGGQVNPSDLGALLEGLAGADGTGGLAGLGLGGVLSPECLSAATASMTLGMLLFAPAMGQALTQQDIDDAFAGLTDAPPEISAALATLREAAQQTVGASIADASTIMSDPAVEGALDEISKYLEAHCSGA